VSDSILVYVLRFLTNKCDFFNIDVVKDMEAKDPHLFEANKSNLRVFSMTEVGYSLGMMLGPLLTGSLFEGVGFFYMTVALGESQRLITYPSIYSLGAAITCLIQAMISWRWLDTLPSEAPEISV
jgi:hypothetical protein